MSFFEVKSSDEKLIENKKKKTKVVVTNEYASNFFEGENIEWDFDSKKREFIDHMNFLKEMDVQESTLYKKWKQVRSLNNTKDIVNTGIVKNSLWLPSDILDEQKTIQEIKNIRPVLQFVEVGTSEFEEWNYLRHMVHSAESTVGVGRVVRITIRDENTGGVIGIAALGSDVIRIGVRDEYIGWTEENKFNDGKLRNTAICTTIVPTQPLGFNFLGGKLIASLLCTSPVQEVWYDSFGDRLVGLTTTSLYGSHSMYQRIPFWKELGKTKGKIHIKPDDEHYLEWLNWLKINHPEEFERCLYPKVGKIERHNGMYQWIYNNDTLDRDSNYDVLVKRVTGKGMSVHSDNRVFDPMCLIGLPPSGPKQNVLARIFSHLKMKQSDYQHGYERGTYFASLYENTREFLRNEISEDLLIPSSKLENDTQSVMDWWVPKAIRRYQNLKASSRIKPSTLYYRDLIQMDNWEDVKTYYLSDVGR